MVHGKNRIPYWIDRRLNGLAGPDYDAIISFGLPIEPEGSQYGEYRFMGALGHNRTFLIYPHGIDIKIPTDLGGITALTYKSGPTCELTSEVAAACHQLGKQVLTAGPR